MDPTCTDVNGNSFQRESVCPSSGYDFMPRMEEHSLHSKTGSMSFTVYTPARQCSLGEEGWGVGGCRGMEEQMSAASNGSPIGRINSGFCVANPKSSVRKYSWISKKITIILNIYL